jgi:glutaredoxin
VKISDQVQTSTELFYIGGCDATLKAAEESDLICKIEQHDLELPADVLIEKLTRNNFVIVFAKSYCPYSKRIKSFFKSMNIEFKAVDLDTLGEHGKEIQEKLKERTGQSTVPNVWVNGKFIGKYYKKIQNNVKFKFNFN